MQKMMVPVTELDQINWFSLTLALKAAQDMADPMDAFIAADEYRAVWCGLDEDAMIARLDGTLPEQREAWLIEVERMRERMLERSENERVAREMEAQARAVPETIFWDVAVAHCPQLARLDASGGLTPQIGSRRATFMEYGYDNWRETRSYHRHLDRNKSQSWKKRSRAPRQYAA